MISKDYINSFNNESYCLIHDFISAEDCDLLSQRADYLINNFKSTNPVKNLFSTVSHKHRSDQYFLESSDKIHFFFEETEKSQHKAAINKIGHALHSLDPVFRKFSLSKKNMDLINSLNYLSCPKIIQSMFIKKEAKIGGKVVCHQDSTFIHTDPDRVLGLWFALEDANMKNGCLWGLPGKYKSPPKTKFIRKGQTCEFVTVDNSPWDEESFIPLEVKKGSVILFNGLFPHKSEQNFSSKSRNAFTLHIIDANSEFLDSNWMAHNNS